MQYWQIRARLNRMVLTEAMFTWNTCREYANRYGVFQGYFHIKMAAIPDKHSTHTKLSKTGALHLWDLNRGFNTYASYIHES